MSVYKLFTTTDGDGAASVDIIKDGDIEAIQWSAMANLTADNDDFEAELSFSSSSGFATNDTKSSIATVRQGVGLTTSGLALNGINQLMPMPNVRVVEGERLYLHTATPNGTAALRITAYVWVNDGLDIAGRQRRIRQ